MALRKTVQRDQATRSDVFRSKKISVLDHCNQKQDRQVHGIEQVEGPLDGLAVGGLAAIVEADGHHGQCAHDLDGHGNPADLPAVAADHPADDENADELHHLALFTGQGEEDHEHHTQSAVVRAQSLRNDSTGEEDHGPEPGPLLHVLDGDEAQEERHHDAGVLQRNGAEEQQFEGQLSQQCADGQPGAVPPGIAGIECALRQQEAVDGKGDPSHHPQPQHGHKGGADVVDEHGHAGDQFQALLRKARFFVHDDPSFPKILPPLYRREQKKTTIFPKERLIFPLPWCIIRFRYPGVAQFGRALALGAKSSNQFDGFECCILPCYDLITP